MKKTTSRLKGLRVIAILILGLAIGYALGGGDATEHRSPDDAASAESGEPEVWTCSMHPQIQLPNPGQCPLCGMDLIPVRTKSGGGLRRLVVSPEDRQLMRVRTVPVERRFAEAEIRMVGKVAYDETRLSYITAWVGGRIDRLYVDFTGITVRAGDHMVYLFSPELFGAQEELLQVKRSLGEIEGHEVGALRGSARATLDAARERLRLAGLTEAQIREVEERGTADEHVTINAPIGGLVIHKNAQEGMYVETGTRIFTIADLSRVWIQLDAYESDLTWLRYGQRVTFETAAHAGEEFTGVISFIDPVLDPRTRTVKVRVIVDNTEGRLKPEMFVNAVVRAHVAGGGRVMDPSLSGKWVSPMHPEIVKDEAGSCDVCGMALVPAEELGYLPAEGLEKPLVIPVSAALVTGTRAIVYVELPDTVEPTYEGREVVLGPRAGNHYLVRHGLDEGDLVVVEGNFKIDSALQIQARPSMMSSKGGAAGSGHAHHHGGEAEETEAPSSSKMPDVSPAAAHRLQRIERDFAAVSRAREEHDERELRATLAQLESSLAQTDMSLFEGDAHAMWMELSMRLGNDTFEAREAGTHEERERALDLLHGTIREIRAQLGSRPEEPQARPSAVPDGLARALEVVWDRYLVLHGSLAEDDEIGARTALEALSDAWGDVPMDGLDVAAHARWMPLSKGLAQAIAGFDAASGIDTMRAGFESVSEKLEETLRAFGSEHAGPVLIMRCPMAFGGRGATWLQNGPEVVNPYFGSSMLECGAVIETLVAAAEEDRGE